MEFFDKKKDVIDLQLTRYGRQLLSLGKFKPVYYAFSDDGVMYDQRWMTGSTTQEEQSAVETRIQEGTPRTQTLCSMVGADRAVFNTGDLSEYALDKNIIDLFNLGNDLQDLKELEEYKKGKLILDPDFADSEKLLENFLGKKRYFNNKAPAWNTVFYNGHISSSFDYYRKDDLLKFIPQINCEIKDILHSAPLDMDVFDSSETLKSLFLNVDKMLDEYMTSGDFDIPDIDEGIDDEVGASLEDDDADFLFNDAIQELFEESELDDGNLLLQKGFLFLSLEEANVDFENENFSLEVFEVIPESKKNLGKENLKKLYFHDYSTISEKPGPESIENIFKVELDDEFNDILACMLINKEKRLLERNIYVSDVFPCEWSEKSPLTSNNPYNLSPVEPEDVC